MCGIIGYIGDKRAVPILIEGLKRLEYRGYDSAGICVIDNSPDSSDSHVLSCVKRKGKITELENAPDLKSIKGTIGIAHTRWATHGEPNETNAHPHSDCKGDISIVHNGIIENFRSLKEILIREGHNIKSDTDSEIIAHMIEHFYKGDIEQATLKALRYLEGAFGLAIIHKAENKIIAARKGSPLVIGLGNGEMFIASDVSAILDHTKKVIYLNDGEIAEITKDNYIIKKMDGAQVSSQVHEINWNLEEIEKQGFKHFMLKEIFEQPMSIENTLRGRIKDNNIKIILDTGPENIKRIIITACGTSWHSALIGKHIFEKLLEIPVEVDYASEFRYRNPILHEDDLLIAISQSGETADTLAALREAKAKGSKVLGIVNVVGSTIARESGTGIYLHAGPEIGVASTKAFTCQIISLLILALYFRQKKGLPLNQELLKEISEIPEKIDQVLHESSRVLEIAKKFKDAKNFLYLGRGINFPVALEGALKLKEISYIHAEGYPAAEMKHGPIALIDENMPVVFLAPHDNTYEKILSNMEEVRARGGKIIAIINQQDNKISALTENIIQVPKVSDILSPLISVIPLQLLAYYIADLKNLNVDQPRNLAKSVTVE